MKAQKFILSAIALVSAATGAWIVKTNRCIRLQLFTKTVQRQCQHISLWTSPLGYQAAPPNVYTTSNCNNIYVGNVTANCND